MSYWRKQGVVAEVVRDRLSDYWLRGSCKKGPDVRVNEASKSTPNFFFIQNCAGLS